MTTEPHMDRSPYGQLLMMAGLSFVSMYILMYAMVDAIGNVYPNFNQLYMAGLMTAPMVIIELSLMGPMYRNKTAKCLGRPSRLSWKDNRDKLIPLARRARHRPVRGR